MKKDEFIEKMKEKFGDKYNYDLLPEFIPAEEEIKIFCNECGSIFSTSRRKMQMASIPCSNCYSVARGKQRTKSFSWFKEQAEKIHPGKYLYYENKYINTITPTTVFCKECNKDFKILPAKLLQSYGCQECGIKRMAKANSLNQEEIENRILNSCGKEFKYEPFIYDSIRTILTFHCLKHDNTFQQSYTSFKTNGICCPECKPKSKAEYIVRKFLVENEIKFFQNQQMEGLYDNNPLLPDFFLPELKIMIEINGPHHLKPVDYSGKLTEDEKKKRFHKQKHHDWLKRNYCRKYNYRYEEIWFFENTLEKLKTILK